MMQSTSSNARSVPGGSCSGSAAPLAEFDEALAVQGFYSRVQRERSDKALDAFDQELREPRAVRTGCVPRFWKPEEFYNKHDYYSPKRAADGFYRQRLKAEFSKVRQRTDRGGRQQSLLEPSTILDDRAYKILIQDALQLRGLPVNQQNVERIEGLVAERLEPKVDTHYKHGDIWARRPRGQLDLGWLDCRGLLPHAHCNAEGR